VIYPSTPEEIEFFSKTVGYSPSKDVRGISVKIENNTQGIVLYDYWTENAVQMHVWIGDPSCLKGREFLHEVFRFPFVIGNRGLAIAATPAHNTASLKFQRFLGFVEIYRIRDGWAIGDDMIISELKRENCVWLRPLPNESIRASDSESEHGSGQRASEAA